jgi:hypothetical protein
MADNPDVRIGTAEREQALEALSRHLGDGRLTLPEFDERSAVVSSATTRGQLDAVFTDLPSSTIAPVASKPLEPSRSQSPVVNSTTNDEGWDWRKAAMAVTPIVALILFFVVPVSNSWLFFLLIPLVGALIYGGDQSKRKRDRR